MSRSGGRRCGVGEPEVQIETQRRALEGREGVHVERHRMADDLVEELLPQIDFTLPQRGLIGLALVPPELVFVCYKRTDPRKASRFLVNHRHGATEQPLHLVAEAGMHSAAVAVNIQGPHELGERTTQDQLAASSPHGFGTDPG